MKWCTVKRSTWGCALLAVALLTGCGGGASDLKLLPVKGTAMKGDKALTGVRVTLEVSDPKIKAPMLFGMVDEAGAFEIQTSAGEKGAPAGMYKVVLSPPATDFDYVKAAKGGPKSQTDLIPLNYQSADATGLSHEVTSSAKPLEIKIP